MIATNAPFSTHIIIAALALAAPTAAQESSLVFPGESGRLLYATQADGDRIMDFSRVGYRFGEEPIPDVPQAATVVNLPGDDTALIQIAINQVAALPMDANGYRGAVILAPGEYEIDSPLFIRDSGVVLRGAGDDPATGTILRGTGTGQRPLIVVTNPGDSGSGTTSGTTVNVIDKYAPVGATSFRVDNPTIFNVGDRVLINRPGTDEWIAALGMDMIPPRADGGTVNQWAPSSYNLTFDRFITRIEGDRLFFDAPISNSIDERFGGATVRRFSFPSRITNVGIEGIRGVSDYDLANPFDEDHAWSFVEIRRAEHCWIRDLTGQHFGFATVLMGQSAKNITATDLDSVDPISLITGGRRYAFNISRGQMNLFQNLTSDDGRHDFVLNSRAEGPNVFLNALATNTNSDTGPHQRWSTGSLFDNVTVEGDQINFRNRGNFGSGHGWSGANMVAWNCIADGYIIQSPPTTAQNWAIGCIGPIINDTRFGQQPEGIFDAHGSPVDTQSLYLKQLEDRLQYPGGQAFEYALGDYDNYTYDGPASFDAAERSPSFDQAFGDYLATRSTMDFDQAEIDHWVPISWQFQVDQDQQAYHAALTIAVRKTEGRTRNDSIWFESLDNRLFFDLDLGLTEEISTTESEVITLEFFGVDASYFNDGDFNVLIGEDVSVDWARLDLTLGDRIPGDLNADGAANAEDTLDFLTLVADNDPRAERTGDMPEEIDFFDVIAELQARDALGL